MTWQNFSNLRNNTRKYVYIILLLWFITRVYLDFSSYINYPIKGNSCRGQYTIIFFRLKRSKIEKIIPWTCPRVSISFPWKLKLWFVNERGKKENFIFHFGIERANYGSVRSSNPHENVISRRGIWLERKRRRRPGKMTDDTGVVTAYKMPTCREATASPRYRFTISIKYRCCPLPVCRTEVIIQMFPMRNVDLRRCSASPSGMKDDRSRAVPRHHGV